ncbi:hypothetical protein [Coxiella burnetii]|uniref:hypothetical protein n=1 Tax=Coxiella burnetii TaxID=777 RepID=UPI0005A8422D|nr:hypothetical protein [Coxiella burnetii]
MRSVHRSPFHTCLKIPFAGLYGSSLVFNFIFILLILLKNIDEKQQNLRDF